MKRTTLKVVLVATLKTKAFWRALGAVALLAGLTVPEGLLTAMAELVHEVLSELGTDLAAAMLTAPWAPVVASL